MSQKKLPPSVEKEVAIWRNSPLGRFSKPVLLFCFVSCFVIPILGSLAACFWTVWNDYPVIDFFLQFYRFEIDYGNLWEYKSTEFAALYLNTLGTLYALAVPLWLGAIVVVTMERGLTLGVDLQANLSRCGHFLMFSVILAFLVLVPCFTRDPELVLGKKLPMNFLVILGHWFLYAPTAMGPVVYFSIFSKPESSEPTSNLGNS